jgi:ankyrin repeat protein
VFASGRGHADAVDYLLNVGAVVNKQDKVGDGILVFP